MKISSLTFFYIILVKVAEFFVVFRINALHHHDHDHSNNGSPQQVIFLNRDRCSSMNEVPNVEIRLYGMGFQSYYLDGELSSFQMEILWSDSRLPITDTYLHIRIIGTTLIPAQIVRSQHMYNISYEMFDQGEYKIEMRISWLTGGSFNSLDTHNNITAAITQNIFIDCIFYHEKINLIIPFENTKIKSKKVWQKPLCQNGNHKGRWMKVNPKQDCPPSVCMGTADSLQYLWDIFHMNDYYVWAPHECIFKIYTPIEVEQCFLKKNINKLLFVGDSLTREHPQNLVTLMNQSTPNMHKSFLLFNLTLPISGRNVYIQFQTLTHSIGIRADVITWSVSMMKLLLMSTNLENIRDKIEKSFNTNIKKKKSVRRFSESRGGVSSASSRSIQIYYVHPKIQREDIRIDREKRPSWFTNSSASANDIELAVSADSLIYMKMTSERQEVAIEQLRQLLLANKEVVSLVVDGYRMSDAQWESSWDGVHYSLLDKKSSIYKECLNLRKGGRNLCGRLKEYPGLNKCVPNYDGWDLYMHWCSTQGIKSFDLFEGGMSRMATMIWINTLCNHN